MGETHETETLPQEMSPEKTRKTRRNGMWNIFEGVDNTVLEKLGLSEDVVHQLVTEADQTVSQHLAIHQHDDPPSLLEAGGCRCRKARILRSFSATVGEDVKAALQSRQRRNAVGNLFDVLTPSQKLLLVEHLQEQLDRLHCLCGEAAAAAAVGGKKTSAPAREEGSSAIIISLTDFTSSSSSSSNSSSSSSSSSTQAQPGAGAPVSSPPPSSKEEVACH